MTDYMSISGNCTLKCPAIEQRAECCWYCNIRGVCVSPVEKRDQYGFDIGYGKHSGFHTPCKALEIFKPSREHNTNIQKKEQERILDLFEICLQGEGFILVDQNEPVVFIKDIQRLINSFKE